MGQRPYAKGRKVRKKERITFMKVLLILSDGMRPDGLDAHPAAARLSHSRPRRCGLLEEVYETAFLCAL